MTLRKAWRSSYNYKQGNSSDLGTWGLEGSLGLQGVEKHKIPPTKLRLWNPEVAGGGRGQKVNFRNH